MENKVSPSNFSAEEALLGAILLGGRNVYEKVKPWIRVNDSFHFKDNRIIWESMEELYSKNCPIDTITVMESCKNRNGFKEDSITAYYLTGLSEAVPTTANVEEYARIVWEKYIQRETARSANELYKLSFNEYEGLENILNEHSRLVEELKEIQPSRVKTIEEIVDEAKINIKEGNNLIPFGMDVLDYPAGGMTRKEITVLGGRPGHGKCLAEGTEIRLLNGLTKKVEDIKPGDLLMGVDSEPRMVESITSGTEMMYEIIPHKSGLESWKCNQSHILSLVCSSDMNDEYRKDEIYNIPILEYLGLPNRIKQKLKQYKTGVEYKESHVEIDPYFLGIWIGDGHSANCGITTADNEVVEFLKEIQEKDNSTLRVIDVEDNKASSYFLTNPKNNTPIQTRLRHYNLINNKHIPTEYKINSREIRLQLLAGIIDSDGYVNKPNNYEISMIRENIIDDILELAWSLGIAGYKHKRTKQINGKDYDVYYASLSGNLDEIPVKIERKKLPKRKQIKNPLRTGITVKPIGDGKYYGFTLKGKDRLFLLKDYTVTHNTTLMINVMKGLIEQGYSVMLFNREMSNTEMIKKLAVLESDTLLYEHVRRNEYDETTEVIIELEMEKIKNKYKNLKMYDHIRTLSDTMSEIAKHKPDVIIDDYIQLIQVEGEKEGRRFEIEKIMQEYKWICKSENASAFLLSQLNREMDKRISPEPKMSDYSESGVIEQTAETAMFVFYGYNFDSESYDKYESKVISAKARYGNVGSYVVGFNGNKCKFYRNRDRAFSDTENIKNRKVGT